MKIIFGDDAASWIPLLSLVVTLISVIVGPLIALRIAKKQIHASIVSSARQSWISSLRDVLAEFFTLAYHISALNSIGKFPDDHPEKLQRIILLQRKLILFLDPSLKPHQDLIGAAEEIRSLAFTSKPETAKEDAKKIGTLIADSIALSQVILKYERVVIETEIGS